MITDDYLYMWKVQFLQIPKWYWETLFSMCNSQISIYLATATLKSIAQGCCLKKQLGIYKFNQSHETDRVTTAKSSEEKGAKGHKCSWHCSLNVREEPTLSSLSDQWNQRMESKPGLRWLLGFSYFLLTLKEPKSGLPPKTRHQKREAWLVCYRWRERSIQVVSILLACLNRKLPQSMWKMQLKDKLVFVEKLCNL